MEQMNSENEEVKKSSKLTEKEKASINQDWMDELIQLLNIPAVNRKKKDVDQIINLLKFTDIVK